MLVPAATAVLACVLVACAVSLRGRPGESFGIVPVAIFAFAFLYVVQPLYLISTERMEVFLSDRQVAKGMLVAALMLVFLAWGWRKGGSRVAGWAGKRPSGREWDPAQLWNFGFGTALTGASLFLIFIGRSGGIEDAFEQVHGGGMAWEGNTAYLYHSPWWVLCGVAMMTLAARRLRRSFWSWGAPLAFAGLMYAYALLVSSRGWFFAATMTVLVAHGLGKQRLVATGRVFTYLGFAGLGVLMVLGYRSVLHLGEEKAAAPPVRDALTAAMAIDDRHARQRTTGIEFVYHAAAVDTVDETGKYHLGINWLYVYTLHLVPRIVWHEKPYGFRSPGITHDDIAATTGLRVAGGAAPGIVADIYWHFGPLSPLFFLAFGFVTHRLYRKAARLESPLATVSYIMLYALSLNAFAQGFGAILVALPYSIAPGALFRFVQRRSRGAIYRRVRAPAAVARGSS